MRKFLLLCILIVQCFSAKAQNKEQLIVEAYGNFYAGEFSRSVEIFDSLLTLYSNQPNDFYLQRGIAAFYATTFQQAIDVLQIALKKNNTEAYLWLARIYAIQNNRTNCLNALASYIQSAKLPEIQLIQQDTSFRKFHTNEGWLSLWEDFSYSPLQTSLNEAIFLQKQGQYEKSHKVLEAVILSTPSSEAYLQSSKLYYAEGSIAVAISEINKALSIDPENLKLAFIRAGYLIEFSQYTDALLDLDRVLLNHPGDFGARLLRASVLAELKSYGRAKEDMNIYLQYIYSDAAREKSALIYYQSGEYLTALKQYNTLIEKGIVSASLYKGRGMTYFKTNTFKSSAYDLSMSLDLQPNDGEANYFMGLAEYKLGRASSACYYWKRARHFGEIRSIEYLSKYCKE